MFDEKSDLADREARLDDEPITQQSADTAESAPPAATVAEDLITQDMEEVEESAPPQPDDELQHEEPEAAEGEKSEKFHALVLYRIYCL